MNRKKLQKLTDSLTKNCKHFSKFEVKCLINLFYNLVGEVTERQGVIIGLDRNAFRNILHMTFGMTDDMIMDRVFRGFDKDNDGCISVIEWVYGLSVFLRGTLEEKMKYCFEVFDLNGDSFISKEEMFHMLKNSLLKQPSEEDPDEGIKDLVEITLKKMLGSCLPRPCPFPTPRSPSNISATTAAWLCHDEPSGIPRVPILLQSHCVGAEGIGRSSRKTGLILLLSHVCLLRTPGQPRDVKWEPLVHVQTQKPSSGHQGTVSGEETRGSSRLMGSQPRTGVCLAIDAVKSFLTLSALWRNLFPAFGYVLEVFGRQRLLRAVRNKLFFDRQLPTRMEQEEQPRAPRGLLPVWAALQRYVSTIKMECPEIRNPGVSKCPVQAEAWADPVLCLQLPPARPQQSNHPVRKWSALYSRSAVRGRRSNRCCGFPGGSVHKGAIQSSATYSLYLPSKRPFQTPETTCEDLLDPCVDS
ncbi:hypothetical protein MJG53_009426 [Ovis ammon polii x Ovis aries]|uniref:Uncharacterized protein n=1 Tax=Ovis ammon polii x Ovis aries TaxID=2918886 RepID=A0ACB9UXH0_9CETA|nr:hypothetical protein MJG53_009426 [Ovis ammon polii x Ovis aries]